MPAASKTALAQADGGCPLPSGHTEDTSCSCQQDHCLLAAGMALSPGNEAPTRSWGFLAFLLQEMMLPCSEPIMNLVGPACRLKGSNVMFWESCCGRGAALPSQPWSAECNMVSRRQAWTGSPQQVQKPHYLAWDAGDLKVCIGALESPHCSKHCCSQGWGVQEAEPGVQASSSQGHGQLDLACGFAVIEARSRASQPGAAP